MKLVTFGIDDKRNMIVQFPVFVHPHNQQHLTLYQLETVPLPIIDRNKNEQSSTHLKVTKPYIALNSETYISLRIQELEMCKKIGYEFYYEELFVVKHRPQHNCKTAIYFDSNAEIIKENSEFQYFYSKTDIKPAVLDRGSEIILANWPKSNYVICKDNHEYPIKMPRHPYVLLKRSVLCNCDIHVEEHSLLESIATCQGKQSGMTIYYTVNTAFIPYLDTFKEELDLPSLEVNQNWKTLKQVLPISLQATPFDNKLLKAPGTLKGLVKQYRQKSQMLDKSQENKPKNEFFDNIAIDIFYMYNIHYFHASSISNYTYCMYTHENKSLTNWHCFSASETVRSSDSPSNKGVLYSPVVCDCSLNNDDHTTNCLFLFIQSKVYHIQKKTLFKYSNYYVILFRCEAVYFSKTV